MRDEASAVEIHEAPTGELALPTRVRLGMRRPANWFQLVKFSVVGGSGYVVNLISFAFFIQTAGFDHRLAATGAFLIAVANNFFWNRRWTFKARDGSAAFQAARFFAVSVLAFAVNLALLETLVSLAGVPEIPAQAIAVACAMPFSFAANKLWSFRT